VAYFQTFARAVAAGPRHTFDSASWNLNACPRAHRIAESARTGPDLALRTRAHVPVPPPAPRHEHGHSDAMSLANVLGAVLGAGERPHGSCLGRPITQICGGRGRASPIG